jgi:mevalonate kinase
LIIPSGVPRSTADQIAKVSDKLERMPELARPALEALGAAVHAGRNALERHDLPRLGEVMNMTHELLSALGVSSTVLDSLCGLARDAGALGAKLTGAGGGGCVIALLGPHPIGEVEGFRSRGITPFQVEVQP